MAYLKFVLVLPKFCTLNAQYNQAPQLLKSYFILTMHSECLKTIKGNVTCSNWKQANLPIKFGGLGLRCSSDQHLAAFISSVESVSPTVVALNGMKPTLENEVNANCLVGLQDVDKRTQKIQEKSDQRSLNDLSQATNVREIARLQSLLAPNAGAWLITPTSTLGMHLSAEEFQICVKYRPGIPVYDAPRNCPFCKNGVMDIYGDHCLTCAGRGDIHRHDRLRDSLLFLCLCKFEPFLSKTRTLAATTNADPQTYFYPPGDNENPTSGAQCNSGVNPAISNHCKWGGRTRLRVNIWWRPQTSCPWPWLPRSRRELYAAVIWSSWWLVWNLSKDNKENSLSGWRQKSFIGRF